MLWGKVTFALLAGWVGLLPSCLTSSPPPSHSAPASEPVDAALIPGATMPLPPIGFVEARADLVFASGQATMTAEGKSRLRHILSDLPKHHAISIDVFNDERSRYVKIDRLGPRRDLSVLRADALAEYLRSPAGGSWTVRASVGRGYSQVHGRPADRRMVFTALGE